VVEEIDCVENEFKNSKYNQVWENIWKTKKDIVRHYRRQRTVEGASSDIYG